MQFIGQIILLVYGRYLDASSGFVPCNGRLYSLEDIDFSALFSVIGNTFGGDGVSNFGVPKIPLPPGLQEQGGAGYYICFAGAYPTAESDFAGLGRVELFASNLPQGPAAIGYLLCDGSAQQTSTYPGLSAVLSGAYGTTGAGVFSLPNVPPVATSSGVQTSLRYCIAPNGDQVPVDGYEDWLGQIVLLPTPSGPGIISSGLQISRSGRSFALPCNGQILSIQDYEVLVTVVGGFYGGGDGAFTFALPKLSPPPGLEHHSYFIVSAGVYPNTEND